METMAKIDYEKEIKVDSKLAQVNIDVKVKPQEYMKVWDMAADKYAQNVTMPGFRKGKAPIAAVKASHNNEISENAFNDMVNNVVQEVVAQAEQKPISTIKITL